MLENFISLAFVTFVTGMQIGFVKFSLGLWLKDAGYSLIFLGLLNLIFLPFSLKMLWMPFLENFVIFKSYGSKKSWMIILDFFIMSFIAGLYFIKFNSIWLFIYLIFLSIVVSTKEAIAISYQMEKIDKEKWGTSEGKISLFYHIGFWTGGTLLFYGSTFISWSNLFLYLSLLLAFLFVFMFKISNSQFKEIKEKSFAKLFIMPYKDLLKRNKHFLLYFILFMILYRLQDRLLMSVVNYFLIDLGFDKFEMFSVKTLGIFCMIVGGFLGSYSIKKIGYKKTLFYGALFHAFSASLFFVQSIIPKSYILFFMTLVFEKLTRGFEGNVFFTYQMIFCNRNYSSTQLPILISLERATGTFLSSFSGLFISYFGWSLFFALSFIGTIPSLFFLRKLPNSIKEIEENNDND